MDPSSATLYLVGSVLNEDNPREWAFEGIWTTKRAALKHCAARFPWFVAPVEVNVALPAEIHDWPGLFYPYAEEEAA
jgi:hypothetical protein